MNSTAQRLNRKLNLIKLVSSNPNITFDSLAKYSGYADKEVLKKELGQLFMVGSYPYTPADYIEIYFDGDGLKIFMPVSIEKYIALNVQEWMSIRKIVDYEFQKTENIDKIEILKSIKDKINSVIPASEYVEYSELNELIQKAISILKSVQFDYKGRKDAKPETRRVDPIYLFTSEMNHYLIGYCHTKKGIRNFRLDSIFNLKITDIPIDETSKPDVAKHISEFHHFVNQSKKSSGFAEVLYSESIAYNLSLKLDIEIIDYSKQFKNKHYIYGKTKIIEKNWFLSIIKNFGDNIILLSPTELVEEFLEELDILQIPMLYF
ncbi:MAG: WYL domain-containing protein [Leptospiraceae bacterium]|nr:WYL domain-containing protein [Leptospiraceae bacterium]MCP5496926.1 WYL domain-containing protein [Leptospiraceae bacterium]